MKFVMRKPEMIEKIVHQVIQSEPVINDMNKNINAKLPIANAKSKITWKKKGKCQISLSIKKVGNGSGKVNVSQILAMLNWKTLV